MVTAELLDAGVELRHDPARVTARLFVPGPTAADVATRTDAIVNRVLSADEPELAAAAAGLRSGFGTRHPDLDGMLAANAEVIRPRLGMPDDTRLVLGAAFTAEFAVEGAALCNPSAVVAPDQSGLLPGQLRAILSLRSIGEPHLSSIQFCTAVIGPGRSWAFEPRETPLHRASIFDLDRMASAYRAEFPDGSAPSQRVLLPVTDEEHHGMEDARFVRFADDGAVGYRATYTAYDGRHTASRLLTTLDFRTFAVHRLTGPGAAAKGMALFPRRVGGGFLAVTRTDGERLSIARSDDGLRWEDAVPVHVPSLLWEVVQSGTCGSPIETAEGWLLISHGVGPMRTYSLGVILLDLEDPTKVVRTITTPILTPIGDRREGYVPNVVYSCGGLVHEGTLWLPYGAGDDRIRVASVPISDLLAALTPIPPSPPGHSPL